MANNNVTIGETMKIKTLAAATLGAFIAFNSAATLSATLKISHIRPQGSVPDQDVKSFIEEAGSASGTLNFNVFAASALGDYTVVQERVSVGAIEMALQPISSASDRKMQIGLLPYLATNWEEARNIFGPDAPLREVINDLYSKQDIKVLAGYPVYFGGIALNKNPGDISEAGGDKGGLKLRVTPFKAFSLLAENLGYISAPLPFSEAFTSVQTGVVDGVMGSGAEGYYNSFRDVTKYYVPQNTHFEMWYLLINKGAFDKLSEDEKTAIASAADSLESDRWKNAAADQEHNEQRLVDAGAVLIDLSEETLKDSANIGRQKVWPVIVSDMGEDWAAPILDSIINNSSQR